MLLWALTLITLNLKQCVCACIVSAECQQCTCDCEV